MKFIDSHVHLYSKDFDNDREEAINAAINLGVSKFLLPNIDLDSIEPMKQLVSKFPKNCYAMIGLHPCSVGEDAAEVLSQIMEEYSKNKENYIAIGEIGIDLYWDKTFLKQQQEAFSKQIDLAKEENLPIVIHCRESFDEIFEILDEKNDEKLKGVFHCFTGNLEQGKRILDYGDFKLGIGGVVTFKNAGLDKVVKELGIDDLVLETDSPYLAPVPNRGKRNESAYVIHVAEKLSQIFDLPMEEVAGITTNNCEEIFKV